MMNRSGFQSQQSMNLIHRTKDGKELWLGDIDAASDISMLKEKKINHVLTSGANLNVSYSKQHNISQMIIDAVDTTRYKMTPHFQDAFQFISQALKKGNILVHCAAGISRSTTFVIIYLMRAEKMSYEQAMGYVRCKRSFICPNYGFVDEMKKYDLKLKKHRKQNKEEQSKFSYERFKQQKYKFDLSTDHKKQPLESEAKLAATKDNHMVYLTEKAYGNKNNNISFPRGKYSSINQQGKMDMFKDYKNNINRLAKGLLSYRVDPQKIITIRK